VPVTAVGEDGGRELLDVLTRFDAPCDVDVAASREAALAVFEERLLDHETAGFIGASTRDLKGARSGMTKVLRFEVNGAKHRATCTIAYR
jgi:hypothetical protein